MGSGDVDGLQPPTSPDQNESGTFDMAGRILQQFLTFFILLPLALPAIANTKRPPKISDWVNEARMKSEMSHCEEAFRVDATENGFVVLWVHGGTRSHIDVPIGPKTVALFHTHDEYSGPEPSSEDVRSAVLTHIPIYVISSTAVWRANPDGTSERIRGR